MSNEPKATTTQNEKILHFINGHVHRGSAVWAGQRWHLDFQSLVCIFSIQMGLNINIISNAEFV